MTRREANLLWCKIDSDAVQGPEYFIDERLVLSGLLHDKMASTLLSDFDEGVTSHILNTWKSALLRWRNSADPRVSRA